MDTLVQTTLAVTLTALCAATAAPAAQPVSPAEQAAWLRWTLPLPRQITIERKVVLAPDDIGIRLRPDAGPAEETAAEQLRALLVERCGVEPDGQASFRIVLGVCDADGMVRGRPAIDPERLRVLPNSRQAYAIVPYHGDELILTALDEPGVYYAAQTLRQLLEATATPESIEVPLAEVLDWPDLEERGEWGGSANRDIEWMAAHKMNLVESHITETVSEDGTAHASMDTELIERGRRNAVNVVPIITHLDHLLRTGIYDAYPQLVGEGYDVENAERGLIAPCASQPEFAEVLAGWMADLSEIEGVTDISAWLSEIRGVQCQCEECQKVGQYVLETRSLVNGYRQIDDEHPDVDLRILLTQGSWETNDKVLEEAPPDVGITYYSGSKTYDSSRDEMIYPLLEDYADEGRWLGCYPQLTASWRIVCPWTGPQFIRYRMTEFVNDGLECLCGYATPDNRCYEFNVLAAAEWSWNAEGRSEREFAAAWATREGFADPDAVAEWAVRMGPVGWDLYGSRVPYSAFFGRAATYVKQRTVPALGEGMYRYFPTLERLDRDIETCEWAAEQAEAWTAPKAPVLAAEAHAVGGMLQMLRGIHDMTTLLTDTEMAPGELREALNVEMFEMAAASQRATDGLRDWRDAIEGWDGASRFEDTLEVIDETASEIGESMSEFGIADPGRPYRMNVIGTWTAGDFEETARIHKTFDVTEYVGGAGTYQVGFRYTSGWNGLHSYAVELLEAPDGDLETAEVIARDEHEGSAGAHPENTVYTLEVDEIDPAATYFVRVDIRGVADTGRPPNRQGCNGDVWMRQQGRLTDSEPPQLQPMTSEQAAAFGPPQFTTDRVHVGVLPGAYGSSSIRAWLKSRDDLEVLPVSRLAGEMIAPCDALVVPQPSVVSLLGEEQAAALRRFVAQGGGLVVTHDAVGFRGLPAIIPQVCAGGLDKARQTQWVVTEQHPVTAGLTPGEPLGQSYYDQILLVPGPDGTVLARGVEEAEPVVIAGEHGDGRYVAIGLAVGIDRDANDCEPHPDEAALLQGAVSWAGG